VTAVEPAAEGRDGLVRIVNASGDPVRATLRHSLAGDGGFERVDLRGRRAGSDPDIAAGQAIAFRPWEIAALRTR